MANDSLVNRIMSFSPDVELFVRKVYWSNPSAFYTFSHALRHHYKKPRSIPKKQKKIDFDKILTKLVKWGVKSGEVMIVHSAYRPLKLTGLSPLQINEQLLTLLTKRGTLAMPGIPSFPNDDHLSGYITKDISNTCYEYNVTSSPIKTGALPVALKEMKGAIRSRHPINTMVAIGPHAHSMMKNNLNGDTSLACGYNSSWKYCYDNDAIIVGLGTDLTHSLTMIHVAEDMKGTEWYIQPWYRNKKYRIRDGDFVTEVVLRERHPRWGALHFGERTLCKDLSVNGILRSTIIDGILLEAMRAKDLLSYLNSRNCNGYPYFWVKKYLTN